MELHHLNWEVPNRFWKETTSKVGLKKRTDINQPCKKNEGLGSLSQEVKMGCA